MFQELDMTPRGLYREISKQCEGRFDTLQYIEKTQFTHVIKLTRAGLEDIEVVCTRPYEYSVTYKNALATIDHINEVYPEREVIWWLK